MAMILGLLFLTVLLHELGHCFAARQVGGEASEVLLWPLGGLAACDVPHQPRAHFLTAAAGPAVNLLICLRCGLAMALVLEPAYRPTWNPFWNPTRVDEGGAIALYRWDGMRSLDRQPGGDGAGPALFRELGDVPAQRRSSSASLGTRAGCSSRRCGPISAIARRPCMPCSPVSSACSCCLVVSIMFNEVLVLFLAFFTYTSCKQEWLTLEAGGEESLFGYDFLAGLHQPGARRAGGAAAAPQKGQLPAALAAAPRRPQAAKAPGRRRGRRPPRR